MTERDAIILVPEGETPKPREEYMFKTVARIGEKEYDVYSDKAPEIIRDYPTNTETTTDDIEQQRE